MESLSSEWGWYTDVQESDPQGSLDDVLTGWKAEKSRWCFGICMGRSRQAKKGLNKEYMFPGEEAFRFVFFYFFSEEAILRDLMVLPAGDPVEAGFLDVLLGSVVHAFLICADVDAVVPPEQEEEQIHEKGH